jgi:ubiquinone/menaquinone biosynthesis C-methylase UbiE
MDFDTEAINWDTERRLMRAKIIADEISKSINLKEEYNALEFGCGTGLVSFNLIDKLNHITLLDTSEGMIEKLNYKIQELKVNNMTTILGDVNTNPVLGFKKFDVIYTSMALHHVLDIEMTLKNLYRILNENGYVCIIDLVEDDGSFHKLEKDFNGHNGFNQDELKKLLEQVGFKNVTTKTFYNDVKVIDNLEASYSLFLMVGRTSSL